MKAEVEGLGNLKYRLTVDVDAESYQKARMALARKYAPHVNMKGFRPGKAPMDMVLKQLGAGLDVETKEKLVGDTLQQQLTAKDLKPSTEPRVEFLPDGEDGSIHFTAEFEALPNVDLKDYLGVTVQEPTMPPVTDEAVGEALARMQRAGTKFEPKPEDGVGCEDDMAVCDVTLKDAEGAVVRETKESRVVVGSDEEPVKGAGRELLGMRAGEEKSITGETGTITSRGLPAAEGGDAEAGVPRTLTAEIKVKQILAKNVPALDDELAKKFGDVQTLDELKVKVRARLDEALQERRSELLKDAVLDAVIRANPLELGQETVSRVAAAAEEETKERYFGQLSPEQRAQIDLGVPKEQSEAEARKNLTRSIVLGAVADKEGIEVTNEDFDAKLAELAVETGMPVPRLRARLAGEEGEPLRRRIKLDKTLDLLMRYAVVAPASEAPAEAPAEAETKPSEV